MKYELHITQSVEFCATSWIFGGGREGHLLPSGFTGIQFEFFLFFVVLFRSMRACVPWGDCQERRGGSSSFLTTKQQSVPPLIPTGRTANRFPKLYIYYIFIYFQIFLYRHLLKHVSSIIFFIKIIIFLNN